MLRIHLILPFNPYLCPMNKEMDLYTDYLLSSFGQVTATGLSALLDGSVSHDRLTRMLSSGAHDSKALWQEVKPMVRAHESDDACLIFDDTIVEKPYTDENEMICRHWDHSKNRNEKGINLLTAFYHTQSITSSVPLRIPVCFECVKKTVHFTDPKTGKEKRKSPVSKNEMMRSMLKRAVENQHLKFRYALADSWFASSDNMLLIHKLKKFFVMDIKSNRLCMPAAQDRNEGQWTNLDKLSLQPKQLVLVWIKDLDIPVLLCRFVFTNKDDSTGEMYLVSNDLDLSDEQFQSIYKKRWSVEEYHKSLKQNASLAKSPTRTITTQTTHLFASLLAYVKLEKLKFAHKMNHFALKSKLYWEALKMAWRQLERIKNWQCA
jgi:hypothetical protein